MDVPATAARQVAVAGRAVSTLKNLPRESRDRRVAGFVAAGAVVKPTLEQWAALAGTSTARVTKALNGQRPKRAPAAALTDLEVLLQDVAETALNIQWRSAEVERAALEELDRLFGQYLMQHENALEAWRDRGGTAAVLERAMHAFDRLLTTVLANNNTK
jgi:diphthamide synthase (EF-2-diphthine--ammonia ligase)